MRPNRRSTAAIFASAALLAGCGAVEGPGNAPVVLAAFACGARATPIHTIQGAGPASPSAGVVVDAEGIVTARLSDLGGFFLQSPDDAADADPATSEGLFVRTAEPHRDLKVGMRVRVRGSVVEEGADDDGPGFTAIGALNELAICTETAALPAPVVVAAPPPDWERFEGMRIALPGPVTVNGNFELLQFGRVEVSLTGRLFHPTERVAPGPEVRALAEANARARLLVDDAREVESPPRVWWIGPPVGVARPWRVGTEIDGLEGVLDEHDGRHRLQLTAEPAAVRQAPRPKDPPTVGGSHTVAAFNLLNWFNGDGAGGGFPTPRGGAPDAAAAQRHRTKLVAAIAAMKPDAAALMEVENDGHGPESAIAQLVAALNAALGTEGDYRLVDPGVARVGGDEIKIGLIYRERRLREAGRAAILEGGPFSNFNRVPLAQAFEPVQGGARFVLVANHFKSKGGCDAAEPADRDRGDGQGCYNPRRVDAARALADWLATDPTASGAPALVVGDLNAYAQEDPLRLLRQRGYVDALESSSADAAYSFVFGGASGRLDHALAANELASRLTGAAEWHINADELTVFDYTAQGKSKRRRALFRADPFRSSDHDPLVVGLDLVAAAP